MSLVRYFRCYTLHVVHYTLYILFCFQLLLRKYTDWNFSVCEHSPVIAFRRWSSSNHGKSINLERDRDDVAETRSQGFVRVFLFEPLDAYDYADAVSRKNDRYPLVPALIKHKTNG